MTRFFARADFLPGSSVVEFSSLEEVDARGGGGDELSYDEASDTFSADDLPETANPVPGEPLNGAEVLILQLEAQ